jgi:hypothetical protein
MNKDFYVVTADINGVSNLPYYFEINMELMYSYFLTLKIIANSFKKTNLIIKPHPRYDYIDFYKTLEDENLRVELNQDISYVNNHAYAIIGIGVPTTGLFWSIVKNKPLVFCNCDNDEKILSLLKPYTIIVNKPEQLSFEIEKLSNSEDYYNIMSDKTKALVSDYFGEKNELSKLIQIITHD